MNVKKVFDDIYTFDNVLSLDNFNQINDEFKYNSWRFNKKESTNSYYRGSLKKVSYSSEYDSDNLTFLRIGTVLKFYAQRVLKSKLVLTRVNTNIQFFGQQSTFHKDGYEGSWTFLVFLNYEWDTEWGGEFVLRHCDGDYKYVAFIPNKGVLFPGHLEHMGKSPDRECVMPRITIAFTYNEVKS